MLTFEAGASKLVVGAPVELGTNVSVGMSLATEVEIAPEMTSEVCDSCCSPPNPQPPSRSRAMTGPAHLPVLKPQQPDAQSASLVQGPVMNCVPWLAAKAATWVRTKSFICILIVLLAIVLLGSDLG